MDENKKSFVLYASYEKHIDLLTLKQRGLLLTAIFRFVNGQQLPELDDMSAMAFSFIQDQLERDCEKWEDIRLKRSEAGKQGAEARKKKKQTQAKQANAKFDKQTQAKQAVNVDVNVIDNVNAIDNANAIENVDVIGIVKEKKVPKFAPPTLDEIKDYCWESNIKIDAQQFFDYYTSNGWKVAKNPMKDWKAAVRNWEHRSNEFNRKQQGAGRANVVDNW